MTDEELEQAHRNLMWKSIVHILEVEPQIAVLVLEDLGWTVSPPDDAE